MQRVIQREAQQEVPSLVHLALRASLEMSTHLAWRVAEGNSLSSRVAVLRCCISMPGGHLWNSLPLEEVSAKIGVLWLCKALPFLKGVKWRCFGKD